MTTKDLFQEIETLSQTQLESVYSFVYLLKNPDYFKGSSNLESNIEPFASENEAIDFANYCAKKVLNETW